MTEQMIKRFGPSWVPRTVIAMISLLIVMFGVGTLFNGNSGFYNSWGVVVFAPVGIIVGSLGIIIALKPESAAQASKKKSRFRGWPKGRARH